MSSQHPLEIGKLPHCTCRKKKTWSPHWLGDLPLLFAPGSDEDASDVGQNLPPTPQRERDKEGDEGDLKKQEMLVQYLRNMETFSLQVEQAISVINNMLYLKTTSGRCPLSLWDLSFYFPKFLSRFCLHEVHNSMFMCCFLILLKVVQEAVQFCVTVHEFSVANSVSGVRKMLPLVWSTDATIKDAVVQAYRRLYLNPQGDTVRSVLNHFKYSHVPRFIIYLHGRL